MRLNTVAFISVALLTAGPAFSLGFSGAEVAWATSLRERGRSAVDVLYGDARRFPVQCRVAGETGTKPCHFEIDVR